MSEPKVIPINRALIRSLGLVLDALKDLPWDGPKEFNAIFIDNKDFVKMGKVSNPPPPNCRFPIRKTLSIELQILSTQLPDRINYETAEFYYYRRIGDTVEYREC